MSGEATGAPLGPDPRKADSTGLTKENGQNVTSAAAKPKTAVQAPTDLGDEPDSSLTDATRMWIKFAKTFAFLFPIYVLGYFEFSFSWILIGLAAFFWWKRNRGGKEDRITRAFAFLDEEERTMSQSVTTSDLPPWVHFPDVERVEWLNKTVKQMWPYICQFVEKLFRDTIEPAVKGANPHLSTFCFSKIDMGDKPLRVNGVKVYTENVDKRQIVMDLQISFVGNTEIDCDIKRYYCRAGIKSIQLHGVLRVIMDPLLGDMPLIGAVSVFFLKKPLLDINWTGLTNMLDIPGLNGLCDNLIQDIIYGYLVLPNRITIPLVGEARMAQLRFPIPKGILRVHFLEAQALEGKDKFLGGMIKGKSDPYGVLQIGNQLFQTKTIKDNLNPKWNEVYEAMVYEHSGQHLEIELFDEDPDKDDFLGSLMIDLSELHKEQKVDEWFVLEEVTTGKLHLKLEWLSLHATPEKLDQALMSIKAAKGQANDGLSSAVLVVYLDSARNLPRNPLEFNHEGLKKSSLNKALKSGKKVSSDPSPFVQFTVGHKVFQSKTRYKTNEPVWEEAFTFLIHNPQGQELEVEVKDEKHECSLEGTTVVAPFHPCSDVSSLLVQCKATLPRADPTPGPVTLSSGRDLLLNLISFTDSGSDPYVRLYLLPDKRRSGRRKTHTLKKNLNPVYDQTFEFSVSIVELHRRTLDVAVKNGGGLLSKHKGLLGKVLVDLAYEDISKGWTQW
ncbi:extended synaptotagmin-2-B-like [Anguilla rostrata]|uniref:extended synaptotagmin-2-B-like n=1 Tax=Anguilla rostrata TaxID=7938 RepID=UPI0030CD3DA9